MTGPGGTDGRDLLGERRLFCRLAEGLGVGLPERYRLDASARSARLLPDGM